MKEKYKALFDRLTPIRSDEELLNAVLDRKAVKMSNLGKSNEKKKIGRKAVIIPAVAAAVLLCTTAGVSAAYAWDIPAALGSFFNKSPKTNDGESNFEFNDFDFEEFGGKVLDQRIVRDGYTVQMKGVVADNHTALIFYDVILEEGHIFTTTYENNNKTVDYTYTAGDEIYVTIWHDNDNYFDQVDYYYEQSRKPDGTFDENIDATKIYSDCSSTMLGADGNIIHCALRHDLKTLPLKNKEIVYNIWGLHAGSYFEDFTQEIVDGNAKDNVTIDFDFVKENDEMTLEGNAPFSLDSGEYGAITYVNMTSLSLDIDVKWEKGPRIIPNKDFGDDLEKIREHGKMAMDEMNKAYPEVKVRFKDGAVADSGILSWDENSAGGAPDENNERLVKQNLRLQWKYPVKTADIDAIIIGDGEFKIG